MAANIRPGAVIFTGSRERLARFYEAMTGLAVRFTDDGITVLGSETFELVIHSLAAEPAADSGPRTRSGKPGASGRAKRAIPTATSSSSAKRRPEERFGEHRAEFAELLDSVALVERARP